MKKATLDATTGTVGREISAAEFKKRVLGEIDDRMPLVALV